MYKCILACRFQHRDIEWFAMFFLLVVGENQHCCAQSFGKHQALSLHDDDDNEDDGDKDDTFAMILPKYLFGRYPTLTVRQ